MDSFSYPFENLVFEWRIASYKLVGQNSKTPNIHCEGVLSDILHFGRNIVRSSTECWTLFEVFFLETSGPAEIAEFHCILKSSNSYNKEDYKVFGFKVPMNNFFLMNVLQRRNDLFRDIRGLIFRHFDFFHEVSSFSIFHEHEEMELVIEVGY